MRESRAEQLSWPTKAAVGFAAMVIAASGSTAPEEGFERNNVPTIEVSDGAITEVIPPAYEVSAFSITRDNCINPDASDYVAVKKKLAEPENDFLKLHTDSKGGGGKGTPEEAWDYFKERQNFLSETAAEHGLTLVDTTESMQKLSDDFGTLAMGVDKAPFDFYLTTTQEVLNEFNVNLSVGSAEMAYAYGGRAPLPEELDNDAARLTMINTVSAFAELPKEFVELIGLKNIVIMTGTSEQNVGGYAITSGTHDSIYINIEPHASSDRAFMKEDIMHELYHLLDAMQCGSTGMVEDPVYRTLNKSKYIYTQELVVPYTDPLSREEYWVASSELQQGMYEAKENGDVNLYCEYKAEDDKLAASVMTDSTYHTNPGEDKAEIGTNLFIPNMYAEAANPRYVVHYEKFIFQAARFMHHAPEQANYFFDIANRPVSDPAASLC